MPRSTAACAAAMAALLAVVVVLTALASPAAARDGPKAWGRKPLMGWNTWCTQNSCGVDWCTSAEVLDVAQTIKDLGMQEYGYDHINLDDCWGTRDNVTGAIEGDPTRFPEGMKAFIAKVNALGFDFGLYTDIGVHACHSPFVGSYGHYKQDAQTFADWNVSFVKFDGCDQPRNATAQDLTCQMSDALNATGSDMWLNFHCWHNEACAECGNSFRVYDDHHDQWQSTSSVINFLAHNRQPFWGADPTRGWPDPDFVFTGGQGCGAHSNPGQRCPGQTQDEYVSEYSIWAIAGGQIVFASDPRNMTDAMKTVLMNKEVISVFKDVSGFNTIKMVPDKSQLTEAANAAQSVGAGAYEDGGSCTVALTKQVSSSPCTLGTSFGCYDGNRSMWTNDGCRGMFTCDGASNVECNVDGAGLHVCSCVPAPPPPGQAWLRSLENPSCAAVVLHNPGSSAMSVTVQFSDVPDRNWSTSTSVTVRDLWAGADVGSATGSFTASALPSHASRFVTLCTQ